MLTSVLRYVLRWSQTAALFQDCLPSDEVGCSTSDQDKRQHSERVECKWHEIGESVDIINGRLLVGADYRRLAATDADRSVAGSLAT